MYKARSDNQMSSKANEWTVKLNGGQNTLGKGYITCSKKSTYDTSPKWLSISFCTSKTFFYYSVPNGSCWKEIGKTDWFLSCSPKDKVLPWILKETANWQQNVILFGISWISSRKLTYFFRVISLLHDYLFSIFSLLVKIEISKNSTFYSSVYYTVQTT